MSKTAEQDNRPQLVKKTIKKRHFYAAQVIAAHSRNTAVAAPQYDTSQLSSRAAGQSSSAMSHGTISANDVTTVNEEVSGSGELLPAFMGSLVTGNERKYHLQFSKTIP